MEPKEEAIPPAVSRSSMYLVDGDENDSTSNSSDTTTTSRTEDNEDDVETVKTAAAAKSNFSNSTATSYLKINVEHSFPADDILVNLLDESYVPSRSVDNYEEEEDTTNNEDEDDIEEFFNEIFPGIRSKLTMRPLNEF